MGCLFIWRFLRNIDSIEPDTAAEGIDSLLVKLLPLADAQPTGKEDRPITYPLQAAYPNALGFPESTDLPVTALQQSDVEPAIHATTTCW